MTSSLAGTASGDALTDLAHRMADAGGSAALSHFRSRKLVADDKDQGAGFDPVTIADREAEAAMRALLARHRPEDGIFGEEHGQQEGSSGLTWVLDPIDGTRAFISGLPSWGVLIALDDGETGRIGVIDQPFTGERFVGTRFGTPEARLYRNGALQQTLAVRPCPALSDAILMTTAPEIFSGSEADAFGRVSAACRLTRFGFDCYAYAMVASGNIDLVIETGLQAYDIAAPAALIRAAGGVVTDWEGGDPRWGGKVIAAGDPALHEAALRLLAG